jgi:hypothetical protein
MQNANSNYHAVFQFQPCHIITDYYKVEMVFRSPFVLLTDQLPNAQVFFEEKNFGFGFPTNYLESIYQNDAETIVFHTFTGPQYTPEF